MHNKNLAPFTKNVILIAEYPNQQTFDLIRTLHGKDAKIVVRNPKSDKFVKPEGLANLVRSSDSLVYVISGEIHKESITQTQQTGNSFAVLTLINNHNQVDATWFNTNGQSTCTIEDMNRSHQLAGTPR